MNSNPLPSSPASLIIGLTGSGKTTYARELAKARRQIQYSIDEWMKTLFWMDAPSTPDLQWALDRCARVEAQIKHLLLQHLACGEGAVLDLGFSTRQERANWVGWLTANGFQIEYHYLDVPREERWQRVEARNKALAASDNSQSIVVNRETFDWMEQYFEPLADDEKKYLTSTSQGYFN